MPIGLTHSATVYTLSGGQFTTVDRASLPCRLLHVNVAPFAGDERAEMAARRKLMWAPGYTMPERARVVITGVPEAEGHTWQVQAGTEAYYSGRGGLGAYWEADLVRVDT